MNYDVLIIGAGLAGLTAALRLAELGVKPALVDYPLPQAEGDVGGFAKFSGAKFSLPPAGMGLVPLAGGERNLLSTIGKVLKYLCLSEDQAEKSQDQSVTDQVNLRSYQSILLSPEQVTSLVRNLEKTVKESSIPIYRGQCQKIYPSQDGTEATIQFQKEERILMSKKLVYAGGRLGTNVLKDAGVIPTQGKGIDVGIRVEFFSPEGLSSLRALGPDAKIIRGNCRTFCLNSPGEIYRYNFAHLQIPGGVVADKDATKSNVGLLLRLENKDQVIKRIIEKSKKLEKKIINNGIRVESGILGSAKPILDQIIGEENRRNLEDFSYYLQDQKLIDWRFPHDIHLPLIDWHWDTFSQQVSFRTSEPAIYCIGDASGHARGLLQAAISGYLVAEDLANELQ